MLLYENGLARGDKIIAIGFPHEHTVKRTCGRLVRRLQTELGHLVGFSIPYQSATSGITKIEYVSTELLVWEIMVDPLLKRRNVIMLEEVHTRHLWSDTLLGLLKMILPHRRDLKLVISLPVAAEGMVEQLIEYFKPSVGGAEIPVLPFNTEDALVPVEALHLQNACSNYVDKAVETVKTIYKNPGDKHKDGGDMLVFLPTRKEVDAFIQKVSNDLQASNAVCLAYYSAASVTQYQAIMSEDYTSEGIWRIIVTTDLGDDDYDLLSTGRICFVIDCGIRMVSETSIEIRAKPKSLLPISRARAESRRFLASNSSSLGKCYRLYTETYFTDMADQDFPEWFHVDLTEFALRSMSLTITNIATDFPFLAPAPPMESLSSALEKLYYLKATNTSYELTKEGYQMADTHLPVMLARAVVASSGLGCLQEMLSIAGMVLAGGIDAVFFDPSGKEDRNLAKAEHAKFQVKEGDYLTLLNVYEGFHKKKNNTTKWARDRYLNYRTLLRAEGIRTQLADYIKRQRILPLDDKGGARHNIGDRICQSICKGFFLNAAKRTLSPEDAKEDAKGYFYQLINEKVSDADQGETVVQAHFTSVQDISEQWIVYEELVESGTSNASTEWQLKGVTAVKSAWLLDTHYYKELQFRE